MMNLVVEIGNTALKAASCEGNTIGKCFRYQGEKKIDYIVWLAEDIKPSVLVVASVFELSPKDISILESACGYLVIMDPSHKDILREKNIPECLSADRASLIMAVRNMFAGKPCTIIDYGTVISFDFIDSDGNYEKGYLSPGLNTRIKSLNRYSSSLPLASMEKQDGNDMIETSIIEGVTSGIMFETQAYLDSKPENMTVFTGGDANYFANKMKNSIFVICNLVLMGLALIAHEYEKRLLQ